MNTLWNCLSQTELRISCSQLLPAITTDLAPGTQGHTKGTTVFISQLLNSYYTDEVVTANESSQNYDGSEEIIFSNFKPKIISFKHPFASISTAVSLPLQDSIYSIQSSYGCGKNAVFQQQEPATWHTIYVKTLLSHNSLCALHSSY